jgi:hypothetical protein
MIIVERFSQLTRQVPSSDLGPKTEYSGAGSSLQVDFGVVYEISSRFSFSIY